MVGIYDTALNLTATYNWGPNHGMRCLIGKTFDLELVMSSCPDLSRILK